MRTYEVLEKALDEIGSRSRWCGTGWGTPGKQACAIHAVARVEGRGPYEGPHVSEPTYEALLRAVAARSDALTVGEYNDNHTHAEVVALFQEAIRAEKAKAGISVDLHPAPAGEGELDAPRTDQARGIEAAAHVKRDAAPHLSEDRKAVTA
jgi:hypothetical protein